MDRRHFIGTTIAGAAAVSLMTCSPSAMADNPSEKGKKSKIKTIRQTYQAPLGDIRGLYIELGHNMWCQWPTEVMGSDLEATRKFLPEVKQPDFELRCKDEYWKEVTDHAARKGINFLVVDLGEGLCIPSHPELAVPGSWSVEKMQNEILRLNSLGMEVIPKLNFSNTHNGWMKDFQHMVSSKPYYQMCKDVIADVCKIFGNPRFFHIGFDEEDQYSLQKRFNYQMMRCGENWWQDFLFISGQVEANGARACMWSDYGWDHPDFYTRCPKSVVQFPWYYDDGMNGYDAETAPAGIKKKILCYHELGKNGFDVVGCGSNWVSNYRKSVGAKADDVMENIVKLTHKVVPAGHLYGYLTAPWDSCSSIEGVEHQKQGIDQLVVAIENIKKNG